MLIDHTPLSYCSLSYVNRNKEVCQYYYMVM
jgi:hypothetical protein